MRRTIAAALAVLVLSACASRRLLPGEPRLPALPPLQRITEVPVRLPARGDQPPVVGEVQRYRIVAKDTLLDVARNAGLGFFEVKDANRSVDEWIPPAGLEVVVPTRWILPRSRQRGIVVNVPEMRMYVFPPRAAPGDVVLVRTWAVAIGNDETPSPVGKFTIMSKDKNPTWIVPDSIYKTMERPRRVVPPGPDNPMGEYRIRLSRDLFSIHGSDTPWAIGRQTTHGCLRLYPEDIDELYAFAKPSMSVEFVYEPVKVGTAGDRVLMEVHEDVYERFRSLDREAARVLRAAGLTARVDPNKLRAALQERSGVPVDVSRGAPPSYQVTAIGGP